MVSTDMHFRLTAGPTEYAELIARIADDGLEYRRLAESSFAEFEERLNWKAWIGRYMELAKLIALGTVEQSHGPVYVASPGNSNA